MNRVLVVLGVLALLGAGAVFFWQTSGPRDGQTPSSSAPTQGAPGDPGTASVAAQGTTTPTVDVTKPPPPTVPGARELFTRSGRVLDPSGQGVAGLSVGVAQRPIEFGGPMADSGRFVARTVTDADGRFALSVQTIDARPIVQWVGPLFARDAPPFLGLPQWVTFDPALTGVELELRVAPGRSIEGRVLLDAVPGQGSDEVRLMAVGRQSGHSAISRIDAEGRFVLDLLFDESYLVVASAGRAVSPCVLDARTGSRDLELALQPVGAVRVEVEGGAPPGLRVECSRVGGAPAELARMAFSGRSPTYLLPGAYSIAVYTQTQYGHASVESVGTDVAPVVVPVRLEPAATLDVKNESGAPRIVVVENAGRVVRALSLPIAGRSFLPVPPGAFTVHEHRLDGTLVASHPLAAAALVSIELELTARPR